MRNFSSVLLAGAAACALAGAALAADTKAPGHEIVVHLPSGGVAEIRYTGPVAPQVVFGTPTLDPFLSRQFERSLAAFNDLSRTLDSEVDALLDRTETPGIWLPDADALLKASLAHDPRHGSYSYSWSSTTVGDRTCTRMVEISAVPGEHQPKIVKQSSGDCRNDATDTFKADWPAIGDPRSLHDGAHGLTNASDRRPTRTTL